MSTATDLFSAPGKGSREPLAARMRPRKLDEYIGQDHIIGPGRLLRRAIQADQLTSVIFYGPPGTGKTTLARVIANHTKSNFVTLNAVLAGVQQIRDSIAAADDQRKLYDRRTILFVDEVHRWNRAQQDALLPWVENGTIILIGATTENPFFEVNKALVSRSRVFQLKQLTENDLREVANAALADRERGYGRWNVTLESAALDHLVSTASGDARSILNALELAVESSVPSWPPADGTAIHIDLKTAEESIQQKVVLYDRDGDYHYDVISAFIKSLRGRDPDAALYWLARMIAAGEDPGFIFRRMLISASEDTGLADPNAITVVESCARAFDRVGLPEGRFHLTHAALYLATCPKSNSAMAFFDALASVEKEDTEVPNHLRDGNRDAEGFGHGQGYAYPHSYRDHWVAQQYLPDELVGRLFYIPSEQGYEGRIRPEVLNRRELQIAAISDDMDNFESSAGGNVAGGTAGDGTHRAGLAGSSGAGSSGAEGAVQASTGTDSRAPAAAAYDKFYFGMEGKKKLFSAPRGEILTFSPGNRGRDEWTLRLDSGKTKALLELRTVLFDQSRTARHHRVLVCRADDGLLLWEAIRQAPEGLTTGLCAHPRGKDMLERYAESLDSLDRPLLHVVPGGMPPGGQDTAKETELFEGVRFDRILCRDAAATTEGIRAFFDSCKPWAADNAVAVCSARIPSRGMRLSSLLGKDNPLRAEIQDAENAFFADPENPLFNWNKETVRTALLQAGIDANCDHFHITEAKRITEIDIARWTDSEKSPYGAAVLAAVGTIRLGAFAAALREIASRGPVAWEYDVLVCAGSFNA